MSTASIIQQSHTKEGFNLINKQPVVKIKSGYTTTSLRTFV